MKTNKQLLRNLTIPFILSFQILLVSESCAQPLNQKRTFTRQDSLRGTLNADRDWWNVTHYAIVVEPDYATKSIKGSNTMRFRVSKPGRKMQLDLQQPMRIDSIVEILPRPQTVSQNIPIQRRDLSFEWEGHVTWVDFARTLKAETDVTIQIYFHGTPVEARRPPWDGGWIWSKDKNGNPWMSVACQGLGASVWYPCKDHQSDEPDAGASLSIIVPGDLMAIGNGRQTSEIKLPSGKKQVTWEVKNPINNYNIVPYIGKYVNWNESYNGEKGKLDLSYWVLDYNLDKAKEQFTQVPKMLKCFEHWFGPYPFYEDGFKLVESPHLGMEHQSAVAYGNKYQNGYLGTDLSGTGWGKKWDFIIIHESGHEWFANNISTNDLADMWVHEGFTNYSETIYTGCEFGTEAGNDYVIGTRRQIQNDKPIIGPYGVNQEGSGDMYYKGGNLLHTIRQIINDDEKFRNILRGLNADFYHKTVDSRDVENYFSQKSGIDFSKVFDQYLRTTRIPVLEYKTANKKTLVRWSNCVDNFSMPVKIYGGNKGNNKDAFRINVTQTWQQLKQGYKEKSFQDAVDRNFYIQIKEVQ